MEDLNLPRNSKRVFFENETPQVNEQFENLMIENFDNEESHEELDEKKRILISSAVEIKNESFIADQVEEIFGEIQGMKEGEREEEQGESSKLEGLQKPLEVEKSKPTTSSLSSSTNQLLLQVDVEDYSPVALRHLSLEHSKRKSIHYRLESRIESKEQEDFAEFFDLDLSHGLVVLESFDDLEEESESTPVIEEAPGLDREFYYAKYLVLMTELPSIRIRNNILQKKIVLYLKRRKIVGIHKDSDYPLDQIKKYRQKLNAYEELININEYKKMTTNAEISNLQSKRDEKDVELKNLFEAMQNREKTIGYRLIYTKTGNEISDKLVDSLIRRQAIQLKQVSSMRLLFIKLKDMVQEKLDKIEEVDIIENNLHLGNYEQLKIKNRDYSDKIEERDEQLTILRNRCQNTIQILAHLREKSNALDVDLDDLKDNLAIAADIAKEYREKLAEIKRIRDRYRNQTNRLKEESGLLFKSNFLCDMEISQKDIVEIEDELAKNMGEVERKKNLVRILRKRMGLLMDEAKIKHTTLIRKNKMKTNVVGKCNNTGKKKLNVYDREPCLYMPTIIQSAFDDLVKIKPSPSVKNRKK
ncbi:hypothetical protein ABEB36_000904 [Hypothenemus hampei]|uniref:CCDC113/CCDC96 coiled-coil domain-containing protein n=1 Tax=Hypothenemus hampei TaxID=57062 RepID=A0ABD1FCT3_HYPHA